MRPELSPSAHAEIAQIARSILHLETLEMSNRDDLDFNEHSVWGIREALEAAYLAGYLAGMSDPSRKSKKSKKH